MDEKMMSNNTNKNALTDTKAPSRARFILSQLIMLILQTTARLANGIKYTVVTCFRFFRSFRSFRSFRYFHCFLSFSRLKRVMVNQAKQHKRRFYIIIAVVIILFGLSIILLTSLGHKSANHGPSAVGNLMRINNMQDALGKIQSNLATTSQMTQTERQRIDNKLQVINAKLGQISIKAGASGGQQIKALRATLQSNSVNLTQKIGALSSEIKAIKSKVFPAPTLSAKALPFDVVAIEPWNGKPYVEIRQKQNITMIDYVGLYGVRGGWKVIDLDAPDQTATFLNEHGQIVHVTVNFNERTKA